MNNDSNNQSPAALEHLTGAMRGEVSWVTGSEMDVHLLANERVEMVPATPDGFGPDTVARFRYVGNGYEIEVPDGRQVWVNGKLVRLTHLQYGDMIEFGETAPLSRFRLYDDAHRPGMSVGDILSDLVCYLQTSRRPNFQKLGFACTELCRRLLRDTSIVFRSTVLVAIALLAFVAYQQFRANQNLLARIESGNLQVESVASALAQAQRDSIRPSDLATLQEELGLSLRSNAERLKALEVRSGASARVISGTAPSVAFLQGGYGLQNHSTGQMLRHVLDGDGVPVIFPNGQPYLALDGTGPVAEVQFNGTGFVLSGQGLLITNRHVAEPWIANPGMRLGGDDMEPVMTRFIAYFPGVSEPVTLKLIGSSDNVDLAVFRMTKMPEGITGLDLAKTDATPGDEVIVMGYPTGLKSLLAQSGSDFVQDLQASGETGFWAVAQKLAAASLIAPLASRGIVGQATDATVVYDAETTHGGSGGPVMNIHGAVVAVNTAIIPEYGGSNIGVPTAHIRTLLATLNGKPEIADSN